MADGPRWNLLLIAMSVAFQKETSEWGTAECTICHRVSWGICIRGPPNNPGSLARRVASADKAGFALWGGGSAHIYESATCSSTYVHLITSVLRARTHPPSSLTRTTSLTTLIKPKKIISSNYSFLRQRFLRLFLISILRLKRYLYFITSWILTFKVLVLNCQSQFCKK